MWILQARSIETDAQREFDLSLRREWILGRSSSADLTIDWDPYLSRKHLQITWDEQQVTVRRLDESKNQVLFQGEPTDYCTLHSGEEVLVGGSLLRFLNEAAEEQQALFYEEISFTSDDFRLRSDLRAERHLQILASLPMLLEHRSASDAMLDLILQLMSQGITEADGILVICEQTDDSAHELTPRGLSQTNGNTALSKARILKHYSRTGVEPAGISQRLWRRAMRNQLGAVLHIWDHATAESSEDSVSCFPGSDYQYDWAFCHPFPLPGKVMHGLYVYGHWSKADALQRARIDADIRFTNLLLEIALVVVQSRQLDHQRAILEQFLPREIVKLLLRDPESQLLDPRECDLTILYCDVVGFTARSERSTGNLLSFLEQISSELACASQAILQHGGIIGDFHGDAVMGFWGWPFENPDAPQLACRAALKIQENLEQLQQQEADIPHGKMRIGIATGRGLAGKIGTVDQVKLTAFGTVVNRADRLQELGKKVQGYIMLDEQTHSRIRAADLGEALATRELPPVELAGIPGLVRCFCLDRKLPPSEQNIP